MSSDPATNKKDTKPVEGDTNPRHRRKTNFTLKQATPGVRQLKRRLTDPGLAFNAADFRRVQRQRTDKGLLKKKSKNSTFKSGSKELGDECKVDDSEELSEVSGDCKPKRLCPKDNIGEEYLLEIKPEESLISTGSKNSPKSKKSSSDSLHKSSPLCNDSKDSGYDSGFKIIDLEQERKRQMIISEMMQTEKTYLEFLQTVVMLFISPLQKSLEKDPEPLLTAEQIKIVFQNIEEIKLVNGELLKQMAKRKRKSTAHWADMLFSCWEQEDFNQAYQEYINGYTQARLFVATAIKPLPPNPTSKQERLAIFAEFVNKQLSNDLCLGFGSLTSFLITPIQRLPRYLLYLKDLHSCTPEGHPDRNDVEQAYELLSKITVQIDQQKLKYDEIYHLQALHQRFVYHDRFRVPEILDPSRKLIAEGPLLENIYEDARSRKERDKVLRYVVLFSDTMICATKDASENLHLEWKIRLYCCSVQHIPQSEDESIEEHFVIKQSTVTGGYPASVQSTFYLFPFANGPFSAKYWKKHLATFIEKREDLYYHAKTGVAIARELQKHLVSPSDWKTLIGDEEAKTFVKDETIQAEGAVVSGFSLISEGKCCIAKELGGKQVLLGIMETGELLGEMSFLSDNILKLASGSILAITDTTVITLIPFLQAERILLQDFGLGKRFFHHICTIIASRYLKIVFQKTGSYLKAENSFAPTPIQSGPYCNSETLSILEKLHLSEEDIVAEYKCKVKGKIGRGHLLICKESICCYSKALGLFGHLSKTAILGDSIRSVKEISSSSTLFIEYVDSASKHKHIKSIEIQFYTDAQRKRAQIHLAAFVGHVKMPNKKEFDNFEISSSQWATLSANQKHLAFSKKDVIVEQGTQLEGIYQVVKGKCRVAYKIGESTVGFSITTGDIFGEIPYVLGTISSAMLIATSKQTVVRVISNKHLDKVLFRQPEIGSRFYLFLARSLRSRFMSIQHSLLKDEESDLAEVELAHPTKYLPEQPTNETNNAEPVLRSSSTGVNLALSATDKAVKCKRTRSFQSRPFAETIPNSARSSIDYTKEIASSMLQLSTSTRKKRSKSVSKVIAPGIITNPVAQEKKRKHRKTDPNKKKAQHKNSL